MFPRVHATRPFLATQRGQASVDPSDTLLLISDMHWYWWFVKVCDDGREGFVPAEVLELPEERLARINRDLNITLPATPLSRRDSSAGNSRAKKSIRFNDECLVSYAVESPCCETDLYDDGPALASSDDTDSDSGDSLASPVDTFVKSTDSKRPNEPVRIEGGDDINIKHELTVRAL